MKVLIFAALFSVLHLAKPSGYFARTHPRSHCNPTSAAKVAITDEATQVGRSTVSNDQGEYVFPAVNPATYTLSVELSGFKKLERKGVAIGTQPWLPSISRLK